MSILFRRETRSGHACNKNILQKEILEKLITLNIKDADKEKGPLEIKQEKV